MPPRSDWAFSKPCRRSHAVTFMKLYAVMADDDQALVDVEFLVCAGWHFAHRNRQAALDARGGELPWLAHVHESDAPFRAGFAQLQRGNFVGYARPGLPGPDKRPTHDGWPRGVIGGWSL